MTRTSPKAYFICTTPRSGSTLLCHMLADLGCAGRPDSHFHTSSIDDWARSFDLSFRDETPRLERLRTIFTEAKARGAGPSPICGVRMQHGSLAYFMEQLADLHPGAGSDTARIEAEFGATRFIHLRRRDKLAQAISRVRAEQTGLWHRAADGTELERLAPPQAPVHDADEIARHRAELAARDADWTEWFAREGLRPLEIVYEELAKTPAAAVARVLATLGLDPRLAEGSPIPTARLADETSHNWAARFKTERKTEA